ncbi:MAG TPA: carboxypeptidase-like regulatory domain-containing protein [bacterium]|nr:carboxypeptidase-like regulatory domain-containing protein [bacterium]HPN43071.1 carboxypeptidase-like regulatory domain-containing protein [bacterium]
MSRIIVKKCSILFIFLLLIITANQLGAATTGKIAGTVKDKASGELLPGVNITIAGTQLGAATDINGYYFIINDPPGNYSVRANMMGYKAVVQSNVLVSVDRTVTADFNLEIAVIEGEEITIVSERPIVEKDVTGSVGVMNASYLDRAPVIKLQDAISQQTGIYSTGETSYFRGGLASEVSYNLDGTSMNSGILSDNWQRLNTSAMQEVSLLTGGYNAEYGNAMSGIVNVVTKEASRTEGKYHGTVQYRVRPAGQYHWGPNIYSNDLYKYTHYNLGFWQNELTDETKRNNFANYFKRFYGWDGSRVPTAEELLSTYRQQITPDPIMGDYTKRPEHDIEGTLYGSITNNLNFLVTGRYKRSVNIYPQAQEYNPEYNIQTKINYYLSDNKKLTLNYLRGGYSSATYTESNWNNMESSQEARWQPNADIRDPYDNKAYGPWGGYWLKGPEEKTVNMATMKWQHTLSPATFYTVQLSYFTDKMTELQDYDKLSTSLDQMGWGDSWFDLGGNFRLEARQIQVNNYSDSKVLNLKTDMVSQVNKANQIKSGFEFKYTDLNYEHYYMEFPAGDVWHLDNVFDGKPIEGAIYAQDKMEYEGLILNVGLRLDAFNAMHDYATSIYDPLGFQTWNGGDGVNPSNTTPIWQSYMDKKDWFAVIPGVTSDYKSAFAGKTNDGMTVNSDWKFALSPRIGLSFPITDNSKLRFNYGHFYQRPSWAKILGFPTSWYDSSPLSSVRMDQWQGYYGHPGLTYERTIQYEVGYDQNFFDMFRLAATAYYKDASNLTRFSHNSTYNVSGGGFAETGWGSGNFTTWSYTRNIANDGHDNIFYTNNAFKDVRGVEIVMEKMFTNQWSANLTFNYGLSSGGVTGYWMYYEDATRVDQPHSYSEQKVSWISSSIIKGSVNYVTPKTLVKGILGDVTIGLYHEYFSGPEYTWYPKDYTGLRFPNNKRWYPHHRTDLKLAKSFPMGLVTPVVSLEVFNLFNYYDRVLLGGEDLDNWEEKGIMPKSSETGENSVWWFYNSISNPKRMIYFTFSLEF